MTEKRVFEKTAQLIAMDAGCPLEKIQPESKLVEEIEMTSLDILILIGDIENAFNIRLADDDLMRIVTMKELTQAIMKQMK